MKYFGAGGRPRSARGIFDGIFNLHQLVKRRGLYAPIDAQLVIRVKCQRPTPAIRAIGMLSSPAAPRSPGKMAATASMRSSESAVSKAVVPLRHARDDKFVYLPLAHPRCASVMVCDSAAVIGICSGIIKYSSASSRTIAILWPGFPPLNGAVPHFGIPCTGKAAD